MDLTGMDYGELGQAQIKIKELYQQGVKQIRIAEQLNISRPRVCKVIKILKKKGLVSTGNGGGLTKGGMVNGLLTPHGQVTTNDYWRVHGLHFMIYPYYFEPRYYRILKERGNYGIQHGKFTITLFEDSLRVQSGERVSWDDPDKYLAIEKAESEFNRFLHNISDKYGFRCFKDGRISIKRVNGHLAHTGSALAKSVKEEYINIRGHDGKVYLVIDKSEGLEHEYIGKKHFEMSERLEPYINDLIYNQPLNNSQVTSRLGDFLTAIEKLGMHTISNTKAIGQITEILSKGGFI